MFFVLSKILNFLTNPLVYVFGFLAASVLTKKAVWKKRCFRIGLSLLFFFSNEFIANEAMSAWEVKPVPYASITKTYDYGIVLTGITLNDRQPADRVYFHHGADRATHTVQLYKKGIVKKIIISGGSGRLVTKARPEAAELREFMLMAGIPAEDILIENGSRNTHESAVRVKEMLGDTNASYLLITSGFHMRRSKACFEKAGFTLDTFSTDFYTHPTYFTVDTFLVPRAESIGLWQKMFKEWTGIAAYWAAGYV